MKFSLVLREPPPQLRDNLLLNSSQLENNYTQLRSTIQTRLNLGKSCVVNGFGDTKEPDPSKTEK